jgi:hydroxypyruvate reductase
MSNQTLLNAAAERARALGFDVSIDAQILEQPIELGCELLLSRLRQLQRESKKQVVCLLSGGEFRCPVRGKGQGGRNSETVLRCALLLDRNSNQGNSVVLSCGTDGVDGNSPAAGAIADQTTIKRGCVAGLDAVASLADSDSFAYFNSLGDAILTGPTGTNVRDLRILLAIVQLPPVSQTRNSFLTCPGAHAAGSMLSPAPQAKAENLPKNIMLLRSDRSAKYVNIENVLMFPALACTGPGSFR